jgi:hypothetical protein
MIENEIKYLHNVIERLPIGQTIIAVKRANIG